MLFVKLVCNTICSEFPLVLDSVVIIISPNSVFGPSIALDKNGIIV